MHEFGHLGVVNLADVADSVAVLSPLDTTTLMTLAPRVTMLIGCGS